MLGGMFKIMASHNVISTKIPCAGSHICGLNVRKPVFVGTVGGLRTSKAQTDQHLCYSAYWKASYLDLIKASFLASLCNGNPDYRFPRAEAHLRASLHLRPCFVYASSGGFDEIMPLMHVEARLSVHRVARTLKKLRSSKRDYWNKKCFSSIAPLFKLGTAFKEQFLLVWKITLTTFSSFSVTIFITRVRIL